MREMKDSGIEWIGKIPASWDISPIKYNYEIVAGATPDSSIAENWDGDIAWITPADYKTNDVYIFKGKRTISNRGYKSCATSLLPIGSIIFSKRAPIGSVAISATSLCTNQGCLGLIKKNGAANNKFFYYVLSIYSDVFNLFGSGTTFKEISTNTFANIALPYPQVSTQERIASFLDSKCSELNSLSADIQKEIETLEQYKRSVITEAVTKGLNPDVEMKDSGVPWIGKMPANWTCIKGKYILKYMQKPVKTDDGVITCFRDGEVTLRSNRREDGFTMADKEIGYQGIDVGDLVVHGMDGFAGAIGISDSRGKASPVLNVLNSRQNKKYIMYYLRSMAYGDVFAALATGIRVRSCDLRWNKLSVLLYPVPPLEEQAGIVQYIEDTLNKVNGVISEKKQQLTVIDSYKKSLIYEYVTGKKEAL